MPPTHHPPSPVNLGGVTGDLDGNLSRVKRELSRIRFPVDFNAGAAREGNPTALLPALHYALLGFSRHVTSSLVEQGHDLQAKSDSRFVENSWRALRELFGYNPSMTPTQFLSPGFAERKLMLLHDTIELCKRRHNEHARERRARESSEAVRKHGVPRVARIGGNNNGGAKDDKADKNTSVQIARPSLAEPTHVSTEDFYEQSQVPITGRLVTRHEISRGPVPGSYARLDTPSGGERSDDDDDDVRLSTDPGGTQVVPENSCDGDEFEFAFRVARTKSSSTSRLSGVSPGVDAIEKLEQFAPTQAPVTELDSPAAEPWFARAGRGRESASDEKIEPASARDDDTNSAGCETNEHGSFPPLRHGLRRSGGFGNENYDPAPSGDDDERAALGAHSAEQFSEDFPNDTERDTEKSNWMERVALAIELRVSDSERAAAIAVDCARNAERVAESAVEVTKQLTRELTGERTKIVQLSSALATQTAKNLLLEKRVRSLEGRDRGGENTTPGKEGTPAPAKGSVLAKLTQNGFERSSSESQVENEMLRYVGTFADEAENEFEKMSLGGARRQKETPPSAVSFAMAKATQSSNNANHAAPKETGAFIDFYSGVLGVDRKQLTLKR